MTNKLEEALVNKIIEESKEFACIIDTSAELISITLIDTLLVKNLTDAQSKFDFYPFDEDTMEDCHSENDAKDILKEQTDIFNNIDITKPLYRVGLALKEEKDDKFVFEDYYTFIEYFLQYNENTNEVKIVIGIEEIGDALLTGECSKTDIDEILSEGGKIIYKKD